MSRNHARSPDHTSRRVDAALPLAKTTLTCGEERAEIRPAGAPRKSRQSSSVSFLMRTLVTGHNGYIGSVLVPMLEGAGHEVVGLDSDLFAAVHLWARGRTRSSR